MKKIQIAVIRGFKSLLPLFLFCSKAINKPPSYLFLLLDNYKNIIFINALKTILQMNAKFNRKLSSYEVNYYGDLQLRKDHNETEFDVKVVCPSGTYKTITYNLNKKNISQKISIETIYYNKFLKYDPKNAPNYITRWSDEKIVIKRLPIELDTKEHQIPVIDLTKKEPNFEDIKKLEELITPNELNIFPCLETDDEFLDRLSDNTNFNARR